MHTSECLCLFLGSAWGWGTLLCLELVWNSSGIWGSSKITQNRSSAESCDSWSSCDGEGLAVMVQSILPPGGCATGGWPGDFIPVLWMGFCPEHQCPELFRENETQLQQTSITVLSEEAVCPFWSCQADVQDCRVL